MSVIVDPITARVKELEYFIQTANDEEVPCNEHDFMHPHFNEHQVSMCSANTEDICEIEDFQAFYSKV